MLDSYSYVFESYSPFTRCSKEIICHIISDLELMFLLLLLLLLLADFLLFLMLVFVLLLPFILNF